MIGAAIDIGSNSAHLLVARVGPGPALEHRLDRSEFLGLGDVVGRYGALPAHDVEQILATLRRQHDAARGAGAAWLAVAGTAPLRRAANAAEVAAMVQSRLGLELRIVTEQEEGELTFLAVTRGSAPAEALMVVDLGGGSSEVILHQPGRELVVASVPTGSAGLTMEIVAHDPPTDEEINRLRDRAAELVDRLPAAAPRRAVFTGGTPTKLARLAPIDQRGLATVVGLAQSAPAADIAQRYALNLRRAQQLAAGAVLVSALLARYGLVTADASEASVREGLILRRAGAIT